MSDELKDDAAIGKLHIGNGISNVPGSWDVPLYVENLTPEARRWLEIGKQASEATRLAFNDSDPRRQAAYLMGVNAGKKQAGLAARPSGWRVEITSIGFAWTCVVKLKGKTLYSIGAYESDQIAKERIAPLAADLNADAIVVPMEKPE